LAVAGAAGRVVLWDLASGTEFVNVVSAGGTVQVVAFSPDGKYLAAGWDNRAVRVWEVVRRQVIQRLGTYASGPVLDLAFAPGGGRLLYNHGSGAMWWSVGQPAVRQRYYAIGQVPGAGRMAMALDGEALAVATPDGSLRLAFPATERAMIEWSGPWGEVLWMAFRPDGQALATLGADGVLRLWDRSGKALATVRVSVLKDQTRRAAAISPDGKYAAVANLNGTVSVFALPAP
jgi:WD40 repeat protein